MKKIFWGIALCVVALQACKKDRDEEEVVDIELSTEEQNKFDDIAAIHFLENNYFDSKGIVRPFDKDDTSDDNEKKLSNYEYVKLPSGVIYIVRPDAQPIDGKTIGEKDAIITMQNTNSYIARELDGAIKFTRAANFSNTIFSGTGVPLIDPAYYYVKKSVLDEFNKINTTDFTRSFFEVAGFREGLKFFKAFDLNDSADYNLQGIIIVPSRAAFGKNPNYYGIKDRSIIFNFQIYRTETREVAGD